MNVYVVHCHPDPDSFIAAVRRRIVDALQADGHEVRMSDLYAEGFEPAMSLEERLTHRAPEQQPAIAGYCGNLSWCDTLVFVYPTWWSGQPAMLTGWLDRVLVSGAAWGETSGGGRVTPGMTNIRRVVAVTAHGSSKLTNLLEGETGRRVIGRSVRVLCHRFARTTWLAMYNIDRSSEAERTAFLDRVERRVHRLGPRSTGLDGDRRS